MRGSPRLFTGFVDGINQRDAPYLLGDTEARDARNVQGTVRGAIRKRDGALGFSTPANALTSLFAAQSPTFLIGAGSTKLFSISPAAAFTDITGALSLTSGLLFDFIQAPASGGQGPVYGMNGSQAVQWTGSGNAAAWTAATGTLPIGKYVCYAGLRVWVAGMASYGSVPDPGSTVVASELGDPRNWPAANVYQFDPNDGESITGLGRAGPYVLVFKPSKTWVIYDPEGDGSNRPLAEGIGCIANRSIVASGQGTFFLSRDQGVFKTNGSSMERINDKIQPTFDALVQNNRQLATGCVFDGHYYLAISTSGTANDLLLDYDLRLNSWWIHTLPVSDLAIWEPTASIPQLHAAAAGVARTDQLFVSGRTQDAGDVNYTTYWRGAHHVMGKPYLRKRCREIHFDGKGVIEVSIAKDFARSFVNTGSGDFRGSDGLFGVDDGSLWGVSDSGIYGGTTDIAEAKFATLGVARAWSVEFGNTTADQMEVESYTMMMDERRD